MAALFIKFITGSWKTTAIGLISAMCIFLLPILQKGEMPSSQTILLAFVVAFLGMFGKDHDKAGTGSESDPIRGPETFKFPDHGAS